MVAAHAEAMLAYGVQEFGWQNGQEACRAEEG